MRSIPISFGLALAQNTRAKDFFLSLSYQQQQEISHRACQLPTQAQLTAYIDVLAQQDKTLLF